MKAEPSERESMYREIQSAEQMLCWFFNSAPWDAGRDKSIEAYNRKAYRSRGSASMRLQGWETEKEWLKKGFEERVENKWYGGL